MSVITDLIDENSSCHARIAELEARIVWLECEAQVNAAPVSEAKAQEPDCDRTACGDFSPGPCDNPDCSARRDRTVVAPAAKAQGVVMLAGTRRNRVYLAGPMTGVEDYNFPAFNAEAARLRAAGLHVENPAEHGIVDGADWADYLRYDIGRLATCEQIHLLPGWSKSKGVKLELQIAQSLGMGICYADGAEEATPVQQVSVPDGWKLVPVDPAPGMIDAALRSEDASLDPRSIVIADYRAMLAAAPAAPAADAGLVEALETIINPIEAMRRELQVGEQLNGMVAMQLASDPEYLRGVAKAAIAAHRAKGVV